uniref:Uncharacterized protein n=1 Tax=Arundo donax TaxID=35708 RepID=A0A0A8YYN2_ARUDO
MEITTTHKSFVKTIIMSGCHYKFINDKATSKHNYCQGIICHYYSK